MRIKFISLVKSSATPLNKDLLSTISENISAFGDVEVVDTAPDLVHICGKWSSASATTIKHYTNKGVPVVFTSANGLTEQLTTLSCMLAPNVFHCCGPAEARLIKKISPKASIVVIANEKFTSTTDTTTMLRLFNELYVKTYNEHEACVKEAIQQKLKGVSDEAIKDIIALLLYLQYAYKRETIRQTLLDSLSDTLINSDYDEGAMHKTLSDMRLLSFAASSMALLEEKSHLTEGFMPIASSADKQMKHMTKYII